MALTAQMLEDHEGIHPNPTLCQSRPPTKINVFKVEEKILIETSQCLEKLPPNR